MFSPLYKGATVQPEHPYVKEELYNFQEATAEQYWIKELATLAPATLDIYTRYFHQYLKYTNKTADQLIQQRILDNESKDMKTKRQAETQFKQFLAYTKQHYKTTTQQSIYASIRSFYEIHYYPLVMRKSDYPKGEANGVIRATKEALQKILQKATTPTKALITTLNDTGLGVSDIRHLKCNLILENPNKTIIHIRTTRQKTGDKIHTFLSEESITALNNYINLRKTGTHKIPPETITPNSPLFRTWNNGAIKTPSRECLSSTIEAKFKQAGYKHMSAHSIRKALQTNLEKSGTPTNWIDLILGHKLINSRDAYSLPTDEELQEQYQKAYNTHIRIFPKAETPTKPQNQQYIEATTITEARTLLQTGHKYLFEMEGIKFFQ
jgi:integrase